MAPTVTIVIPCYNRAHTIRSAIGAVLAQTIDDWEVVVVDDASTDDLAAALAPYADDGRIRTVRHPVNRGPGAARNTGVAVATGRFVAFLDSDDGWRPEKLRRQLDAVLAQPDPDNVFCVTETEILLDAGRRIVRPLHGLAPGRSFAEYLYLDGGFAQTSSYFLSRDLARRFPFNEDLRQLEDHLFFIEVGASGAAFLLVREVLTVWRNETATDRASFADDLAKWTGIVACFSQLASAHVAPHVLLAGEVRFLSGRLWKEAPLRSLGLMSRALIGRALSPTQLATLFGRNVLPVAIYDQARHWLALRHGRVSRGAATRSDAVGLGADPDTPGPGGDKSILFVTEELFLPPRNGSQQTYAAVAHDYAAKGWKVFCISFYRDPAVALSPAVADAYRGTFADHLLLPGWNRGGTPMGKLGQFLREADRSVTGNVLPSHPFLVTKSAGEVRRIVAAIRRWNPGTVYVHKVHGLQLLGRVIDAFPDKPVVLSLHDDFVLRARNYDLVHKHLFGILPLPAVLRSHRSAWVRHHLGRSNQRHSRTVERRLLERCDTILVCSTQELNTYLADPVLHDRLIFQPLSYDSSDVDGSVTVERPFDAGFIGSEDVMNIDALLYFRDDILPLIRAAYPEFRLLVAGRVGPVVTQLLQGVPGVTIWPQFDRLEEFYQAFKLAIIPMRYGTGVSVRFLEALKFRKPVVSTTIGIRGHAAERPSSVVVVDDPAGFARSVVDLTRPPVDAVALQLAQ